MADMREAQAKTPKLTQTIRGQDIRLDGTMNKLVWGGKAKLETPAKSISTQGKEDTQSTEATPKQERRKKKKKRKKKKDDDKIISIGATDSQKVVAQSMAAGAALGAIAVAAAVFLGGARRS